MSTFQNFVSAIALIIKEYVADVLHMYTYLMGTSRLENTLHKGDVTQTFQYPVMGNSMFTLVVGQHGHLHTVFGIPADVTYNGSFVLFNDSPYQCTITSFGGFVEELYAEIGFGVRCLCYNPEVSLSMRCTRPTCGSLAS